MEDEGLEQKEKTVQAPVILEGFGIHSGKYSKVILYPSHFDSGIRLGLNDLPETIFHKVLPFHVLGLERRTGIRIGGTFVQTVEHLMASLAYLGIRNIDITFCTGNEVPAYDGSAWSIIEKINEVGIVEQESIKYSSKITDSYVQQFGNHQYVVDPYPSFYLNITLDFPSQSLESSFCSDDCEKFSLIMHSRSFIFEKDIDSLHLEGIGLGISMENCNVISTGEIDLNLNILQECIYHKMLDFIGDTYLMMMSLPKGRFILRNPHHKYNIMFAKGCIQANIIGHQ